MGTNAKRRHFPPHSAGLAGAASGRSPRAKGPVEASLGVCFGLPSPGDRAGGPDRLTDGASRRRRPSDRDFGRRGYAVTAQGPILRHGVGGDGSPACQDWIRRLRGSVGLSRYGPCGLWCAVPLLQCSELPDRAARDRAQCEPPGKLRPSRRGAAPCLRSWPKAQPSGR